jgi:hypothetical protein
MNTAAALHKTSHAAVARVLGLASSTLTADYLTLQPTGATQIGGQPAVPLA